VRRILLLKKKVWSTITMYWKPLILMGLLLSLAEPWSNLANAESLFHLDDLNQVREHGQGYVNATIRLEQIQQEGHQRIERVIVAIRQSRSVNEAQYWKMDFIEQRVWLVNSQVEVCIDLIKQQEKILTSSVTENQARNMMRHSNFYRGMCTLHHMQQNLRAQSGRPPLEDDLLAITLASMGRREQRLDIAPWEQKRRELIARLRSMRQELVYLAKNLDRIGIDGGGNAASQ
jgi:hypothetical protein